MENRTRNLLIAMLLLSSLLSNYAMLKAQQRKTVNIAFTNGKWFNGKNFDDGFVYSTGSYFTRKKPSHIDTTINLNGLYILPPFAEAHNHNIGTGVENRDRKTVQRYLADGVFYVKIQGNLPMSDQNKTMLHLNQPDGLDVSFAQGTLTATGGHPSFLVSEILPKQGYFPGYTKETLKDYRYFTIDNEADFEEKWPAVLRLKPDFIKTFLLFSNEYEKHKSDTTNSFRKGLNPALLPTIVQKAHASGFRVSTHVANVADFHNAVFSGADEITHLPIDTIPVSTEDAMEAARRKTVVITTCSLAENAPPSIVMKPLLPQILNMYKESLERLYQAGVAIAVGSDDPMSSSIEEFLYLHKMGVLDNLTLLKMWTETTPKTIFPKRRIGTLKDGYEASFVALEANPLEDLNNVRKVRLRFKQGNMLRL
jgi:imidazolonepropionase-like amidohydrolase